MDQTECKNSKQCAPAKHHFDDCVERVTNQESEGEVKEDCVEECTYTHPWLWSATLKLVELDLMKTKSSVPDKR